MSGIDEGTARRAGALLGQTGQSNTVDALVVAEAAGDGRSVVLTGDSDDLRLLAALVPNVEVEQV